MTLTYKQKATKINNAAKYLAALGYHVTTSFLPHCDEMEVAVYFYEPTQKESLESILRTYKDEGDDIEFSEFFFEDHSQFYVLILKKHPS